MSSIHLYASPQVGQTHATISCYQTAAASLIYKDITSDWSACLIAVDQRIGIIYAYFLSHLEESGVNFALEHFIFGICTTAHYPV